MRVAVLVALRDLRGRLRDRSAWITAFAAPVALAAILSLAFGAGDAPEVDVAVAAASSGETDPAATHLLQALASMPGASAGLTVRTLADEQAVRGALEQDEADAGIIVHPGPAGPGLLVLRREDAPVSAGIAQSLAQGVALHTATGEGPPFAEQRLAGRSPTGADYFGPAMAVFFVFFVMAFAPLSLIAERRDGTLARLAASPIRMGAVLAGKGLAVFVLALVSVLVVWGVTWAVFGADWGSPPAVLALIVGVVLSAGGLTTLAAAGARTERQADGQINAVVFAGALLGGNFLPLSALPDALRQASLLTPNGWAMRGFVELSNGAGLVDIAPNVAALLMIAAATGGLAMLRARRAIGIGS